jgi:VanZ family protein
MAGPTLYERCLTLAARVCVVVLAVLSWTPGFYMVRTDVLTGHEEHFLAYLISGLIIAAAPRRSQPMRISILLCLYAGLLELGQNFVPGRHPAVEDFAASALGAIAGIVLTTAFRHVRRSRRTTCQPT